jgi:hypothetical protein
MVIVLTGAHERSTVTFMSTSPDTPRDAETDDTLLGMVAETIYDDLMSDYNEGKDIVELSEIAARSVLAALSGAGRVVLPEALLDELLSSTTVALSTTLGNLGVFRRAVSDYRNGVNG